MAVVEEAGAGADAEGVAVSSYGIINADRGRFIMSIVAAIDWGAVVWYVCLLAVVAAFVIAMGGNGPTYPGGGGGEGGGGW